MAIPSSGRYSATETKVRNVISSLGATEYTMPEGTPSQANSKLLLEQDRLAKVCSSLLSSVF